MGNPVLILERGERVETPPALCLQATGDPVHPRERCGPIRERLSQGRR
jgi:hypothetical protein